jgi:hypothetical protein
VTAPTHQRVVEWLKYDARTSFFINAIQFINWEKVEGDIIEFGVSVGKSFGLLGVLQSENLALWQYTEPAVTGRRLLGFDTFTGLPKDDQIHPRWQEGSFGTNYLVNHPFLKMDEQITPGAILSIFDAVGLPRPELGVGLFSDTAGQFIPAKYSKAALVHIDSDLYQSARDALNIVEPTLQDGTLILFDDWFMYKANPEKGEQRAFKEFLDAHPEWRAVPYQPYSVFCNSFILSRR